MRRKVGKKLFVVFEEKNKKEYESKENNTHFVHKINLQKTDDHLRRNVGEKDKKQKWKHRFLKKENKACLVYGCVECRYIQSSRWAKNPYFFWWKLTACSSWVVWRSAFAFTLYFLSLEVLWVFSPNISFGREKSKKQQTWWWFLSWYTVPCVVFVRKTVI